MIFIVFMFILYSLGCAGIGQSLAMGEYLQALFGVGLCLFFLLVIGAAAVKEWEDK